MFIHYLHQIQMVKKINGSSLDFQSLSFQGVTSHLRLPTDQCGLVQVQSSLWSVP